LALVQRVCVCFQCSPRFTRKVVHARGQRGTIVDHLELRSAQRRSRSVRWLWLLWLGICACSGSRATGTAPSVGSSSSGAPLPAIAASAARKRRCSRKSCSVARRMLRIDCSLCRMASPERWEGASLRLPRSMGCASQLRSSTAASLGSWPGRSGKRTGSAAALP